MDRRITMSRFQEPDEKDPPVLAHCFNCNDGMVEGQEVVVFEDYLFCDTECLYDSVRYKNLGGEKYGK